MTAYTMDQIAKFTPELLHQAVINTLLENSPILRTVPMQFWGVEGKYAKYTQTWTLPASQQYDDGDTINETVATRYEVEAYIKRYANQFAIENFQRGSMSNAAATSLADGSRSVGNLIRDDLITGVNTTVAIGTGSATKGVDGVIPGPRTRAGVGSLKFNDTGDLLQYAAPGDSDYGTAVAVAADLNSNHHFLRSNNKTWWIMITFDISDSATAGDWEYTDTTDGLTFTTSKEPDGILSLVDPDQRWYVTKSATVPGTNGDAITLTAVDFLMRKVFGPLNEQLGITHHDIVDDLRTLIGANARPADWNGSPLAGNTLQYRNLAIVGTDEMPASETVGSTTDCKSLVIARMNSEAGLGGKWADPGGGVTTSLMDDATGPANLPVPVWMRQLPEKLTLDQIPTRITSHLTWILRNSKSMVEMHGIT